MQVERLEAELEVYQMKNSSLMKQAGHHHSIPQGLVESKGGGFFLLVRWKAKVIDWTRQCRAVKVRMRSMKLFWPACRVRTEYLNRRSNLLRKNVTGMQCCRHVGDQAYPKRFCRTPRNVWLKNRSSRTVNNGKKINCELRSVTWIHFQCLVSVLFLWWAVFWRWPWQTDAKDAFLGKVAAQTHALVILELSTQNLVSLSTPTSVQRKVP